MPFDRLVRRLWGLQGDDAPHLAEQPPTPQTVTLCIAVGPDGVRPVRALVEASPGDPLDEAIVGAVVLPLDQAHTWLSAVFGDDFAAEALDLDLDTFN